MSKVISAEFLASMRAQFPDNDVDAAASWIATLSDIDNPETMLSSLLAKGKFPRTGQRAQRQDARTRGALADDGGWDRHQSQPSRYEGPAAAHARHCATWCEGPAAAAEYLASTPEAEWYASVRHLWATLDTPAGWHCAPTSNTAQAWIKAAALAPKQEAPTQQAEARLLRDWTKD